MTAHRWIAAALATVSACAYDARDGAIWTGAILRDGTSFPFVGYDPYPAQGQGFGAAPTAFGYIHEVDDRTLLVKISLEIVEVDKFVNDRTPRLTIKDTFLTAETGMGLSYIEQQASSMGSTTTDQPYRQVFLEGHGGTTTGTFDVTNTDYSTFIDGHLDAVLVNPSFGRREVHAEVHWLGPK